jgi:uncharacterized damage-inducible protein DinB
MDLGTVAALFRYDSWANELLLDAVSRLTREEFTRDLKNSFGSIRDTLVHVVWAEWIWLERWKGASPAIQFSPADFPDVERLRTRFREVAAERDAFLRGLAGEALLQILEYRNLKEESWRYPLWQQLLHVVNHSTYHRGQVVTMLRQLGAVPPATDFLVYCDQPALRAVQTGSSCDRSGRPKE